MSFEKCKTFVYRLVRSKGFRFLYRLFCLLPLKHKRILFASDSRSELSGNFKYIYEEMIIKNLDLDYRFALKDSIDTKKTFKEIAILAYLLATSRFILIDDFYPMVYPLKIRKGADLIQVWHAAGAFKKFGYSRMGLPGGPSPTSLNHKNYTKVIVSSKNVIKQYAEGFGVSEDKIYPIGVPRTDIFFSKEFIDKTKKELYSLFPFLEKKKIILYTPTFRGNGQSTANFPIDEINVSLLYEQLNADYIFIYKLHPFIKNTKIFPEMYNEFFVDFSNYKEVNDLLLVADILITDYSSVCFEFALLNKPMIFFAFDLDKYTMERDFYYEYTSFVPGKIVKTSTELVNVIHSNDFMTEKIKPFVDKFFDQKDGKSSERFVNEIIVGKEYS
ncbi:CDP-glycerol glycerophosphotransferase family protein [Fredinandcohnia sp. FSL W7-1320]|uniref:CDP-glycerol glycerophosphotransferase family protein n=1 Tax=Fredinandcohnia sp. FSL W7-1320 TaxID=2954540 RepID=UPI0030FD4453